MLRGLMFLLVESGGIGWNRVALNFCDADFVVFQLGIDSRTAAVIRGVADRENQHRADCPLGA